MIKLREISDSEKYYNESDFYIKIKIVFESWYMPMRSICYWSILGSNQSLVEIAFVQNSGAITEFTIVSMPNKFSLHCPVVSENAIEKKGLPLFAMDAWINSDDYYLREKFPNDRDLEIYRDDFSVYIIFSKDEVALKVINNDIVFGFDKNNVLCFIQMAGMKLNEEGFLEKIG
ncbi:MAG: hypothetical protein ABIF12_00170 [bacterium]